MKFERPISSKQNTAQILGYDYIADKTWTTLKVTQSEQIKIVATEQRQKNPI